MSKQFRDSVWKGMVQTDRLHRYYGKLTGRMARLDRGMTVGVLVLASVTAALAREGHELVLPAAIVTAIVSALPLIFRLGDRVTATAYCSKRLRDLSIGWEELWQEVYGLQPEDDVDERFIARWRRLATTLSEITALKDQVPENKRLHKITQDEAHAYWREQNAQLTETAAAAH